MASAAPLPHMTPRRARSLAVLDVPGDPSKGSKQRPGNGLEDLVRRRSWKSAARAPRTRTPYPSVVAHEDSPLATRGAPVMPVCRGSQTVAPRFLCWEAYQMAIRRQSPVPHKLFHFQTATPPLVRAEKAVQRLVEPGLGSTSSGFSRGCSRRRPWTRGG